MLNMKLFDYNLNIKKLFFILIICLVSTSTKGQQEYPANFEDCIKKLNQISKSLKESEKSLDKANAEIDAKKVESKELNADLAKKQEEIKSLNLQIESINKNQDKIIAEKVDEELKKQIQEGKVVEKKDYDALDVKLSKCNEEKLKVDKEIISKNNMIGKLKEENDDLRKNLKPLSDNLISSGASLKSIYESRKKLAHLNFDIGPDFIKLDLDSVKVYKDAIDNNFKMYVSLKENPNPELKEFGIKSEQYLRACEILYELNGLLNQLPNKKKIDDAVAKAKSSSDFKSFPSLTVKRDKYIDILGSSCAFFTNVETYYIENQKIVKFTDVAKTKTLNKYQAEAANRKFLKLDQFIDKIIAGESPTRDCK